MGELRQIIGEADNRAADADGDRSWSGRHPSYLSLMPPAVVSPNGIFWLPALRNHCLGT